MNLLNFSCYLKSKVNLDLRFGFSVPKSSRGTNFQPNWTELRIIFWGRGKFINQSLGLLVQGAHF